MAKQSLYEALGVERTATPEEIKLAYRRKAMEFHPDRNQGNEEAAAESFRIVQHAYDVLSDPERRAEYDATGEDGEVEDMAATAQEILAQMMVNIAVTMTEGGNPNSAVHIGRTDPIAILFSQLRDQLRGIERSAQLNTIQAARLKQILERLSSKKRAVTETPVFIALSEQHATMERRSITLQKDRELVNRIMQLAEEYAYRTDVDTATIRPAATTFGTLNLPNHG